jgi:nucleotide-binding universal stress UspA family protein
MSYKTIVVHVDDSIHAAQRIRIAAALAAEHGAHQTGVAATGVSRFAYPDSAPELAASVAADKISALRERARAALSAFEQRARAAGVRAFESALVEDDAGGAMELRARYADLVVVSQVDRDEPDTSIGTGLPEYLMLNTGRPVLIVPYAGTFPTVGATVLVAWDESGEAMRAVSNALMLERARQGHGGGVQRRAIGGQPAGPRHCPVPGPAWRALRSEQPAQSGRGRTDHAVAGVRPGFGPDRHGGLRPFAPARDAAGRRHCRHPRIDDAGIDVA